MTTLLLSLSVFFYCSGVLIAVAKARAAFFITNPQSLRQTTTVLIAYLIQIVAWPVFVLVQYSPVELMAKLFLRDAKGYRSHQHQRLKSGLYDVMFGKNRYLAYHIKTYRCRLEDNFNHFSELRHAFGQHPIYVTLYYGRYRKRYYLCIMAHGHNHQQPIINNTMLDNGKLFDEAHFVNQLLGINGKAACHVLEDMGLINPFNKSPVHRSS